jgi:23S rRNA (adenine2503-C2)-methyltransferase
MESIFDYTEDELLEILLKNGFKKYNKDQIIDWIYKKKVYDFDMMSNLSKNLIMFLKNNFEIKLLDIETFEKSNDTKKYLLKLNDNNKIECVLMYHDYGKSLCVSTEVGCNMGCAFCESGRLKKVRNLTTSEMVLELLTVENDINDRIDNVVIMGIGEPFDNYDNFERFINILTNPKMIELGSRKITVSTCGLVPKIYEFADLKTQVNLAISLHASNDELRCKLMPINRRYKIKELIEAIKYYLNKTNRRVTIEYIMLKNVNDSVKDAQELAKLLKGLLVYVNIIPYNETENNDFKRSDNVQIKKFYDILINNDINATIRREFGSTVSAACGQLRAKASNKEDLC